MRWWWCALHPAVRHVVWCVVGVAWCGFVWWMAQCVVDQTLQGHPNLLNLVESSLTFVSEPVAYSQLQHLLR